MNKIPFLLLILIFINPMSAWQTEINLYTQVVAVEYEKVGYKYDMFTYFDFNITCQIINQENQAVSITTPDSALFNLLIKPDFEIETDGGRAPTIIHDVVTSHDIESGINNYILKVSLGIIGDIDDLPIGNYTIIFQISQIQEADQYEYIPFTLCNQEASIISCSSSTFPNESSNTTIPVNYSFFLGILLLNRIKKRSS